jgi:hypothetical protein
LQHGGLGEKPVADAGDFERERGHGGNVIAPFAPPARAFRENLLFGTGPSGHNTGRGGVDAIATR